MRTHPRRTRRGRGGFTLMEILVALVLIGLIVAVVLPSVISQASRGEVNKVLEDLTAVQSAAKMFRVDVQRWPGRLEHLVTPAASWTADTDLFGNSIAAGLQARWKGPYLELGSVAATGLETALGGIITEAFDTTHWGGTPFLTVQVEGIPSADAGELSLIIDGDTVLAATSPSAGRVRWTATSSTLLYLAAPVN